MKVFYFIAWLVRKLAKSIARAQDNFKERLSYRPGEGVAMFIGISILTFIVMLLPVIAYADTWPQVASFFAGYWIASGCYFVYSILSVLYDKFSQEQEDFVNKLKR